MYCTQCSQAILLTKVSGFLINQADFINMHSLICPDDPLIEPDWLIPLGGVEVPTTPFDPAHPGPLPLYRRLALLALTSKKSHQ